MTGCAVKAPAGTGSTAEGGADILHAPTPACSGDCQEEVASQVAASGGRVQVFCIEPSQANFAQLIVTRDLFFKDNKPTTQW